jgi:hypothetical protein
MKNFTLEFRTKKQSQEQLKEFTPTQRPRNIGKVIVLKNGHKYEPSDAYLKFIAKIKKI